MGSQRYIFADRDGTLIEDRGYMYRIEDYAVLQGVEQGLRLLGAEGFRIAVLTNQSGIGRGYFSQSQYERFQSHLVADFAARGVTIDASFFCPHLPDAGCRCRKPAAGLLERARDLLGADLARSWVIGDRPSDIELARRGGCRSVYVLTGYGAECRAALEPDVPVAEDLAAAAHYILASERTPGGAMRDPEPEVYG